MSNQKYLIQEDTLTDIADAIREKEESSAPITVSDFSTRISEIPTSSVPFPPFSTTEIVVGTWLDNKPLYRKTITADGSITSTSSTAFHLYFADYGIDITKLSPNTVFMGGESTIFVKSGDTLSLPVNYVDASNGNKIIRTRPRADNNGEIFMDIMNDVIPLNTEISIVINLYYTKIADSPVQDVSTIPGNHYSTTEKAVTTTTDGETVYEKTIYNTANLGTQYLSHGIANLKEVWIDNGSFTYGRNTVTTGSGSKRGWCPVNYLNHNQSISYQDIFCRVDKNNLVIYIGSWIGSGQWDHYTTLRYTKKSTT